MSQEGNKRIPGRMEWQLAGGLPGLLGIIDSRDGRITNDLHVMLHVLNLLLDARQERLDFLTKLSLAFRDVLAVNVKPISKVRLGAKDDLRRRPDTGSEYLPELAKLTGRHVGQELHELILVVSLSGHKGNQVSALPRSLGVAGLCGTLIALEHGVQVWRRTLVELD